MRTVFPILMSNLRHLCLLACFVAPAAPQPSPEKLIEEGHWKQARAIVEQWIREKPNEPLANFLLSQIRNAFHDRQSPLGLAENAVRLDGGVAKYHRQLAEVIGVTAQHSGMFQQLFLARRFKKEIDTAVSQDPNDLQALRDLMEFYLLAPVIAGGDKDKARGMADRIGRMNIAEGCFALVRLAEFNNEPGKVEGLLRKAEESQPGNYRARIALASYYLSAAHRNYDLAARHADEAMTIGPGRIDAYAILSAVNAAQGNWTDMEALLARAEKAVPDDLTPYYRAAEAILLSGREFPRAERLLRKYLATTPEGNAPTFSEAHWQLGLVMEKEARRAEAIAEWSESVRLDSDSPAKRELRRLKSQN